MGKVKILTTPDVPLTLLDLFEARHCGRKNDYPTVGDARTAAHQALRRGGSPMHPYFCVFCKRWHIGHGNRTPRTTAEQAETPNDYDPKEKNDVCNF